MFPGEFSSSNAKDFIISLGKHSVSTQGMENVEDADTTKVITVLVIAMSLLPMVLKVRRQQARMSFLVMKVLPWRS
jgi:hypothetical protein